MKKTLTRLAAVLTLAAGVVAAAARPAATEPSAGAVLLVHGIWSGAGTWQPAMSGALQQAGYQVEALDFRYEPETLSNEAQIQLQAQALARRLKQLLANSGQPWADVVAHSMGGLAARAYLQSPELWPAEGQSGVRRLVTLGTPHWGTDGFVLDPVGGVSLARLLGYNFQPQLGHPAVDRYQAWSPALQQMFAEWQPAPVKLTRKKLGYPEGFVLARWPSRRGKFRSPIQPSSYLVASQARTRRGSVTHPDALAVNEVLRAFPQRGLSVKKHIAYYQQQAAALGTLLPAAGTPGVDARRVSPFLQALNASPSTGGAELYLLAGSRPFVAEDVQGLDLPSPFNSDPAAGGLLNDGIVPTDSSLGRDPISGTLLFPDAPRVVLDVTHEALPSSAQAVQQVMSWLTAPEMAARRDHSGSWSLSARWASSPAVVRKKRTRFGLKNWSFPLISHCWSSTSG